MPSGRPDQNHPLHTPLAIALGLPFNSPPHAVRAAYHKQLARLHPHSAPPGAPDTSAQFIALQEAYKKYLVGDDSNCLAVVPAGPLTECRCGGRFDTRAPGRVECEFCSCFVIVEEVKWLGGAV